MGQRFQILLELIKFRISVFSTFTTSVGFILAAKALSLDILAPTFGILFLAFGSAVLNQYQERQPDALMERTRNRPIPTGRVRPVLALLISLVFVLTGSVILYFGTNLPAFFLGLLALVWYNGIYTNLKKVTAFAVVPGSLIGSIPPAVGWAAGGGDILDPPILAVMFFFFIWQVPHFWLLILLYGRQYEKAGFPSLTALFSNDQIKRLIFIWIVASAVACVLIPFFGVVDIPVINVGLYITAIWLVYQSSKMFGTGGHTFSSGYAFRQINIYALVVILLMSIDSLVN
ncbi:MAG: protoheme IX farnesyltransferase [bacterium]